LNLGAPVAITHLPGVELPLRSGLLRIEAPSRLLVAGFSSTMPAVLVAGGTLTSAGELTLRNPAPLASSTIRVAQLTIAASNRTGLPIPVGQAASAVFISRDGAPWGERIGLFRADSVVTVAGPDTLSIPPGETISLEIEWETAFEASSESVRFGIHAVGIGVVQPSSALLEIQVQPQENQNFPFWTLAGNFTGADLSASYSNFPNPFAAGREQTKFAFYLRESARVKLRILTIRGEEVCTLLEEAALGAGLHQDTSWDGRNDRGDTVLSGVYVADLEVRYADGTNARELHKVAVVR
jgi:hypothetical protein